MATGGQIRTGETCNDKLIGPSYYEVPDTFPQCTIAFLLLFP